MKKLSLLIAALCGAAFFANAQVKVGLEAGASLSNIAYDTYNVEVKDGAAALVSERNTKDNKFGPRGGVVFDIPFSWRVSMQLGAQYAMKGYKYTETRTVQDIDYTYKQDYTFHYAEVPINFVARLGGGSSRREFYPPPVTHFIIYGGPYIGYAFAGKGKDDSSFVGNNTERTYKNSRDIDFGSTAPSIDLNTFEFKKGSELQAIDYGFQVGAGVEFPFGLYVKAQYQMGLANLSLGAFDPTKNPPVLMGGYTKNTSMSLIIGYWLN